MKKTLSGLAVAAALGVTLVGCGGDADLTPFGLFGPPGGGGLAGYRAASTVLQSGSPIFAASADLNGDGVPDLVSSNAPSFFQGSDGSLSISLAQAPGVFGEPTVLPLEGAFLTGLVLGDFDEDGDVDIAVADYEGLSSYLAVNQGGGVFAEPTPLGLDCGFPIGMVGGDFNEDGHLDLAATDESAVVGVILGNGDGTFGSTQFYDTGLSSPFFLATADVNGDGHLDLGVTDDDGPDVAILEGDGTGGFDAGNPTRVTNAPRGDGGGFRARLREGSFRGRTAERITVPVDGAQAGIVLQDLNGDNLVDVAVALPYDDRVAVALNLGSGEFGAPSQFFVEGVAPLGLAAGDFDRDGDPDLATANLETNDVSILEGSGTGTFDVDSAPMTCGIEPFGLLAADLDLDGLLDLVPANEILANLTLLFGRGDGSFGDTPLVALGTNSDANPLAVGDLNRDGLDDFVVAAGAASEIHVALNTGAGSFGTPTSFPTASSSTAAALGDLDGDGDLDLALTGVEDGQLSALLNDGTGSFGAPATFLVEASLTDVELADVDGDGDLDAVVAAPGEGAAGVLPGDGAGAFGAVQPVDMEIPAEHLVARDLDGDGDVDLAAAGSGDAPVPEVAVPVEPTCFVSVVLNDGTGAFGEPATQGVMADQLNGIAAGDVDGGGSPDLVVCGLQDRETWPQGLYQVLHNDGSGVFQQTTDPMLDGRLPTSVVLTDVNGDGRADLVGFDLLISSAVIRLSAGTDEFLPAFRYHAGSNPIFGGVGNFNNDGFPDFAASNDGSGGKTRTEAAEGSAYVSILNSIVR